MVFGNAFRLRRCALRALAGRKTQETEGKVGELDAWRLGTMGVFVSFVGTGVRKGERETYVDENRHTR